ncbi:MULTISPECIES: acylphosphatase [Vibrio]|uniref:Acylphosphatase n=1 Tax=Vibrio algicola TaxID=2662262 RepID=A0A5Q0TCK5_9VIBR|nr:MULTISPECIES: acylphosphatase [Vibrio]MBD1576980.1 acylphosphatase [Vibrio sp. S11_S32]
MAFCNRLFFVSGSVQGVGFRYQTAHQGLSLGLTGYAKNLNNGDVEVLVCGDANKVDEFVAWLKKGPRSAFVAKLVEQPTDKQVTRDFSIL